MTGPEPTLDDLPLRADLRANPRTAHRNWPSPCG